MGHETDKLILIWICSFASLLNQDDTFDEEHFKRSETDVLKLM